MSGKYDGVMPEDVKNPESAGWIPKKSTRDQNHYHRGLPKTLVQRVFGAIGLMIKQDIIKVYDEEGNRYLSNQLGFGPELAKRLKGKTLILSGGRELTGEDLTIMVRDALKRGDVAWTRIDAGIAFGQMDKVGNKGTNPEVLDMMTQRNLLGGANTRGERQGSDFANRKKAA